MNRPLPILLLCLSLCLLCAKVQPARILLIPGALYSHVNLFSIPGKALKDEGHEVYVLSMAKFESTLKKHGLVPLLYNGTNADIEALKEKRVKKVGKGEESILDVIRVILPIMSDLCKEVNRNESLMNQIRDLNFDLVINDATAFYTCFYTIPYRFGLRYMSISAGHDPWTFGVSGMPSVEPTQLTPFTNRMSFSERLINLVTFLIIYMNPVSYCYSEEHLKEFAPHRPYKSLRQLVSESELTLVNHDIICSGYPRVSAPNYRYIGGSSTKKAEPLPQNLQEFADGATEGLIILSLGSRQEAQGIWESLKPIVLNVLGRLPQRAIVHYNLDDHDAPKNVKLLKWLPQNDLLGHPNTKVFITHGGNNGQLEAIYHGVPVLTLPIHGDQTYNGAQAKSQGFGLVLDLKTITESKLHDALTEIISNKKYSNSIKKCSEIVKSMPSSQETAVFWVNHILRFGGDHLRPPSLDIPMYQILMLDVFAFIALALLVVIILIAYACCCVGKLCRKSRKQKSE